MQRYRDPHGVVAGWVCVDAGHERRRRSGVVVRRDAAGGLAEVAAQAADDAAREAATAGGPLVVGPARHALHIGRRVGVGLSVGVVVVCGGARRCHERRDWRGRGRGLRR